MGISVKASADVDFSDFQKEKDEKKGQMISILS